MRWMKLGALFRRGALLALMFGRFLLGLYLDIKGVVSPAEMWARPVGVKNISHLLEENGRILAPVVWFLGIAGALVCALFGQRPARFFAIGFLIIGADYGTFATRNRTY